MEDMEKEIRDVSIEFIEASHEWGAEDSWKKTVLEIW